MDLFSSSDIDKMVAENDVEGLLRLLDRSNPQIRLQAAMALAELDEPMGWQYLMDAAGRPEDPDTQRLAAAMLGDLNDPRAVPVLEKALEKAGSNTATAIKQALESIEGPEAEEALRHAGYEPVLPSMSGNLQMVNYGGDYVRSAMPDTSHVDFLTAQQHLDNAIQLREDELTERGLVEDSLTIWLAPEMAYAWYLRGVLFEDLDRYTEAALCYRWALELDPNLQEAKEASGELEETYGPPVDEVNLLLEDLASRDWTDRRDAAAEIGDLGEEATSDAIGMLIRLLGDDEREVRHAVIEALGNIGDQLAIQPLAKMDESSWLLRFAVIEALSQLKAVGSLNDVLHREMDHLQERNPVFSSEKDPMLEVEYERLMEVGVLAFERTGDIPGLLALAESVENGRFEDTVEGEEEPVEEVDEDLEEEEGMEEVDDDEVSMYVDEVAQMVSLALERLVMPDLADQDPGILQRLAVLPDLVLYGLSEDESEDSPTIIHDYTDLREAAKAELARRGNL